MDSRPVQSVGDDDQIAFAEEGAPKPGPSDDATKPWKILVVDDEPEVHHLTRMVLDGVRFGGRGLRFLSAHSGAEARRLLALEPDIAIALIDVVMETDDAGLDLVRYLRRDLGNGFVRIILRTGQAGLAPERKVVVDYDINDYKDKSELTATKLFTTVTTALRGYVDLCALEDGRQRAVQHRRGLEKIVDASQSIFELHSLRRFAQGMLMQFESLLGLVMHSMYGPPDGLAAIEEPGGFRILAATGQFASSVDGSVEHSLDPHARGVVARAVRERRSQFGDGYFVCYVENALGLRNLLVVRSNVQDLSSEDQTLIRIFNNNISIAFQNISLKEEIEETQREVIHTLGEATEARSRETGFHVRRVGEFARLLGRGLGLSEGEVELLRLAAPLHDVGKIAIPDSILLKPGRLTPEEFERMQKHTTVGHQLLHVSHRQVLRAAAVIALEHHERFDGKGYPHGLAGTSIELHARITSVADVFDALACDRVYRPAWSMDRVLEWFVKERGKAFDPDVVDALLAKTEDFLEITKALKD